MTALPGAGPVTAVRLGERGIRTIWDLLAGLVPRGYSDLRRARLVRELADVPAGARVLVVGRTSRVHQFARRLLDVWIEDEGEAPARVRARWFRPAPGFSRRFAKGSPIAVAGPLRRDERGEPELVQPQVATEELAAAAAAGQLGLGVEPVYPRLRGVPRRTLETLVARALDALDDADDPIPASLRAQLGISGRREAAWALHRPGAGLAPEALAALSEGRTPHHRRLVVERALATQLAARVRRAEAAARPALACPSDEATLDEAMRRALPFALTGAQRRAIAAIAGDLGDTQPMQRLLVGDVGSGKTAVVLAAALVVARAGATTLLLAPTELLAEQHTETFTRAGAHAGLRVARLSGGLPRAEADRVRAQAAAGQVDVLIGTHALLEADVTVARPALAVVDEQHRFGVAQRARLRRSDSGMMPHLLVLSATPIPRTLALALYGDLDVTMLDERPPGRAPVRTTVLAGEGARRTAWEAVRAAVARGEQALVVAPRIGEDGQNDDDDDDAAQEDRPGAIALARALTKELAPARLGLVHGRLDAKSSSRVLTRMRQGALDVLVATTVIEVGIDLPRATVMVIGGAERLGLAQLHQLRGRVGRGERGGACFLLTSSNDEAVRARLALLAETDDGFRIAEADLLRRGPGDVLGARQSGFGALAGLALAEALPLLTEVRLVVDEVWADDPGLARHPGLRRLAESAPAQAAREGAGDAA